MICHIIGVSIVVYMFFVFIRSYDIQNDIGISVRIPGDPTGPESCCINEYFVTIPVHELLVSGNPAVEIDCKGNVRGDMLLDHTGEDRDRFSGDNIGPAELRCDFPVIDPG